MCLCVYLIIYLFYSGIGRGIAIKLAELGAKVVAVARTQEELDSLQKEVWWYTHIYLLSSICNVKAFISLLIKIFHCKEEYI